MTGTLGRCRRRREFRERHPLGHALLERLEIRRPGLDVFAIVLLAHLLQLSFVATSVLAQLTLRVPAAVLVAESPHAQGRARSASNSSLNTSDVSTERVAAAAAQQSRAEQKSKRG